MQAVVRRAPGTTWTGMISVVIATYSRARLLGDTLEALERQLPCGTRVEVVIADNGPDDGTAAVVRAAALRGLPVRYLVAPEPGKSHAMNAAVAVALGDLLVMTDDDVLPDPGWLKAIVSAFHETDADFVVGRILPRWEAPPPAWMSPSLHGVLAVPDNGTTRRHLTAHEHHGIMAIGTNMAVRRSVVAALGGWRTDLGKLRGTLRNAEDHEFFLRMLAAGCRGVYEPSALVHHRVPAERLTRSYFRRWLWENGRIVARLERQFPTTRRYFAGAPGYLWRRAADRPLAVLRALRHGDSSARFAHVVQLLWFAGYLRERWLGRRETPPPIPLPLARRSDLAS